MHRYFACYKLILGCAFLMALGVVSCNSTSTPERLQLVDGKIDACLLITPTELETVTGFETVTDSHPINPVGTSCAYRETEGSSVLQIFVTTDATLKRVPALGTAEHSYNFWKTEQLKNPELYYTVEDVDGLGSQAYFSAKQNWELTIHVVNNGILYEFTGYSTNGTNRDQLIQIAKIALQRAP